MTVIQPIVSEKFFLKKDKNQNFFKYKPIIWLLRVKILMQDVFGIFYFTWDAFECALDSFNPTRSVEKNSFEKRRKRYIELPITSWSTSKNDERKKQDFPYIFSVPCVLVTTRGPESYF